MIRKGYVMNSNDPYWKLAEDERHFNKIQAGIRNRASTWLLASFAAIAVLIQTGNSVDYILPQSILIGMVSLMTTIGLFVLWVNDQMVYHRLLYAAFLVGLKMEKDDPTLPPIKLLMMHSAEGTGMHKWLSWYYTIPMKFFCGVTFLAIIFHINLQHEGQDLALAICGPNLLLVVFLFVQMGLIVWIGKNKDRVESDERAKLFGDKDFDDLFNGTSKQRMQKFGQLIANHHRSKNNSVNSQGNLPKQTSAQTPGSS